MPDTIFVVDDDTAMRDSLTSLLESYSFEVRAFDSAHKVLDDADIRAAGCLVADVRMPDMDGLSLQEELARRQIGVPVIILTGFADVPLAVRAMKAGAIDFIEKPFDGELLLDSINRALAFGSQSRAEASQTQLAESRIALLTARERQVLEHLVGGHSNKVIAYQLDISPRTVEIHRARLTEKMQARGLSDLIRLALAAGIAPAPKT